MQSGNREVRLGTEVVSSAGQSFREITGLISKVSSQVKEISGAIEQMAVGSQQIVGAVKTIDDLSKAASGEAETVSAATEEQSAGHAGDCLSQPYSDHPGPGTAKRCQQVSHLMIIAAGGKLPREPQGKGQLTFSTGELAFCI
jgi:hypothetical protein